MKLSNFLVLLCTPFKVFFYLLELCSWRFSIQICFEFDPHISVWFSGYGMMPNGKDAGASKGKGLKGGVFSPEQPGAAPQEGVAPQQALTQGAVPVAPEPTSGILVMVTQEKYQKFPFPVPQGKSYKQMPLIPHATPAPALPQDNDPKPALEPTPEPAVMGPQGKGPKAAASGPAPVVPQSNPAPEPAAVLPQGKYPKPESVQCCCSSNNPDTVRDITRSSVINVNKHKNISFN